MFLPNLKPKIGQQPRIVPMSMTIISKIIGKCQNIIEGPKIVIGSIVRNEEITGSLKIFLDCCQELERYHNNIVYVFIEGDSSDKTYDILKNWIEKRDGSILEKIYTGYPPFLKDKNPVRIKHLAELRNILIDNILSIPDANDILMIDASYGWKGDIISSLREIDSDIAAPLVVMITDNNGRYVFYDTWAFRKNGKTFEHSYPYIEGIESNNPVEIDSAGSCYLLKRRVLDAGIRYNGINDCEHVSFCQSAKDMGFSIKINPKIYVKKMVKGIAL